jgi:phage tail-like protein
MAKFSTSMRYDPYKNFKFRVKFGTGAKYVAGVSKMSALKRTTEIVGRRNRKLPGLSKSGSITLKRGVTHDIDFNVWASKPRKSDRQPVRKNLIIDGFNEAGQKTKSYRVFRCWVSEYQAASDFDASTDAVHIDHIKIENEGWQRAELAPSVRSAGR